MLLLRNFSRLCSARYNTGMSGTGLEVVPNVPKCGVRVYMSYRTCRSIGYGYGSRTEPYRGVGVRVWITYLPDKYPHPGYLDKGIRGARCIFPQAYRTYLLVFFLYEYGCRTECTELLCTGVDVVPNVAKIRVTGMGVVPSAPRCRVRV